MYLVKIGFNVALDPGEIWDGPAGTVMRIPEGLEVRFEPGEKTESLPLATDISGLIGMGVIEEEKVSAPAKRSKKRKSGGDE